MSIYSSIFNGTFVGGVEFLRLLFFFFLQRVKQKKTKNKKQNKKTLMGEKASVKKEEIYFVQTAEHPV